MTTIVTATNKAAVDILSSIGQVASSATKAVTTVATSLDMLDLFIQKEFSKQKLSTKIEMHLFEDHLVKTKAIENAKFDVEIAAELAKTPNLAVKFDEYQKQFANLLNPPENP
jgi:hypothetical protein